MARRTLTNFGHSISGPQIGTPVVGPTGKASLHLAVGIDMIDVVNGFKNLSGAYRMIPGMMVHSKAEALKADIRFYTPIGPTRAPTRQVEAANAFRAPTFLASPGTKAWSSALGKVARDISVIENRVNRSLTEEERLRFEAGRLLSVGHVTEGGGTRGSIEALSRSNLPGQGSLWNSISTNVQVGDGAGALVAYSDNYYAWFVENGFTSKYVPVPYDWMDRKYRPVDSYVLQLKYTGLYLDLTRTAEESWPKDVEPEGERQILFIRRKKDKWIPGAHMFEKGFNDFLMREEFLIGSQFGQVTKKVWEDREPGDLTVMKVYQRRDHLGRFASGFERR